MFPHFTHSPACAEGERIEEKKDDLKVHSRVRRPTVNLPSLSYFVVYLKLCMFSHPLLV